MTADLRNEFDRSENSGPVTPTGSSAPRGHPLRVVMAVFLTTAVALVALLAGRMTPLPRDGFLPGSAVTHTVMLLLSLVLMVVVSHRPLASFGFTRGSWHFRPTILLWGLPTACLSVLALAAGPGDAPAAPFAGSRLQLVLLVWVLASVSEEVLTRGLLQSLVAMNLPPSSKSSIWNLPVVISALFFGAMHLVLIESMGPMAVVPIVLATFLGFVAARYRQSSGSLIPAVIVHALFNAGGMLPGWIYLTIKG